MIYVIMQVLNFLNEKYGIMQVAYFLNYPVFKLLFYCHIILDCEKLDFLWEI